MLWGREGKLSLGACDFPLPGPWKSWLGPFPSFICLALSASQWPQGGKGGGDGEMR